MRSRFTPARAAVAAVPVLLALTIAACGSSSSNNQNMSAGAYGAPATTVKSKPAAAATAKIGVGHTKIGDVLVDGQGRTLYVFAKDTGMTSTCNGECAVDWPPATTGGSPKAGAGVSAAKLGTSMRADGPMQVTWAGHPVYRFAGDQSAGQTAGDGLNEFGGVWHAVRVSSTSKPQHKKAAAAVHAAAPVQHAAAPVHHAAAPAPAPVTKAPVHSAPAPMHTAAPAPSKSSSGIPQNNGGDMDADNNGGPSDGDGGI